MHKTILFVLFRGLFEAIFCSKTKKVLLKTLSGFFKKLCSFQKKLSDFFAAMGGGKTKKDAVCR